MRTPQEIILEFRNVLYWSQPNMKYNEMLNLINELENTLFPSEVVIEGQTILMKNEEGIFEEIQINEEEITSIIDNPIAFTEPTEEDIKSFNGSLASSLEIEQIKEPTIVEEPVKPKRTRKIN